MSNSYHPLSKLWHWLIAALVIMAFTLSWTFGEMEDFSPEKTQYINWHKWAGIGVLFFTVLRTLTRLVFPPPPLPSHVSARMPAWQRTAHKLTLMGMLALCVVIPVIGWVMSNAFGYPVVWLGLVHLPDLTGTDEALAEQLATVHEICGWLLATLISIHILASLKHHFIDKDSVLRRMLPWG